MSTSQQQHKEEEYLELKIPLSQFPERDEIKSIIAKSPLFDKGKNSKELAAAFAYVKKVLEELEYIQTGRYREIIIQRTLVKYKAISY